MHRRIARVLLDSPLPQLDRPFDYAVPEGMDAVAPGVRVRVPLRSAGRMVDGLVVSLGVEADGDRALSDIDQLVSPVCVMPDRLYTLARRVADRAAGSASDVLRLVIPKRQVRVEKTWQPVTDAPVPSPDAVTWARGVIERYAGLDATLRDRGRAAVEAIPAISDSTLHWTELFTAAALRTLADGASSILIVPDHRDLDRLLDTLAAHAPESAIVRFDSRQSNPDRYRALLRSLDAAPCIVVGNRSAVYAPAVAGLVAMWDDGDSLLAEPLAPYVHSRDVALVRQELEGSALLLAGLSRSTDAERLVATGWLHDIRAERRITPKIVLSTPQELEQPGRRVHSSAFTAARAAVESGPVLVQVARPGYAPTLVCAECRAPARCTHCGGPLGAHRHGARPVCAWCARDAHAWACSACSATSVRLASAGSERTADELGRAFPGVRVIVADGTHTVERVPATPALVVATRGAEPVAEGGYAAVILLDGARMLQAPTLRIAESCLRWWSNAAGLAAPGAPIHLVGVDGPAARALATWTQPAYARTELAERAPLRLPPSVRVAQVEGVRSAVDKALAAVADVGVTADAVLGPVPVDDTGRVRALVRFEYRIGTAVAQALRAAVISAAVARRTGRRQNTKPPLTVRLDILEPDL